MASGASCGAGRQDDDFRPGLPFYRFWTVLERAGAPAENRIVGQFEQLHESRLLPRQRGPARVHLLPRSASGPRSRGKERPISGDRCLECHADRGCSLPVSVRLGRSRDDDCTSCHMPRLDDVEHESSCRHRRIIVSAPRGRGSIGPRFRRDPARRPTSLGQLPPSPDG